MTSHGAKLVGREKQGRALTDGLVHVFENVQVLGETAFSP